MENPKGETEHSFFWEEIHETLLCFPISREGQAHSSFCSQEQDTTATRDLGGALAQLHLITKKYADAKTEVICPIPHSWWCGQGVRRLPYSESMSREAGLGNSPFPDSSRVDGLAVSHLT